MKPLWSRGPRARTWPPRLAVAIENERASATTALKRNLAEKKLLLITWLFAHGNRISDPLRLTWSDNIDLEQRTYQLLIAKPDLWKTKPIDDEVFALLANDPDKTGYVFPWRTKSGVYKWLRPLCRELEVTFTPHMARHSLGKALNRHGAGLKTIMGALDHSDPASSLRYQDADVEIVREAQAKVSASVGKLAGKKA
jgi:integrase